MMLSALEWVRKRNGEKRCFEMGGVLWCVIVWLSGGVGKDHNKLQISSTMKATCRGHNRSLQLRSRSS